MSLRIRSSKGQKPVYGLGQIEQKRSIKLSRSVKQPNIGMKFRLKWFEILVMSQKDLNKVYKYLFIHVALSFRKTNWKFVVSQAGL